jgi:hypothetical protein
MEYIFITKFYYEAGPSRTVTILIDKRKTIHPPHNSNLLA